MAEVFSCEHILADSKLTVAWCIIVINHCRIKRFSDKMWNKSIGLLGWYYGVILHQVLCRCKDSNWFQYLGRISGVGKGL